MTQTWAQQPAPKAPYVAPIPASGHWTIQLKSSESAPSVAAHTGKGNQSDNRPVLIDTLKSGLIKRTTVGFKDGTSQCFDQSGPYFFQPASAGSYPYIPPPEEAPYPFYSEGFLFFENVSPSWFKNVLKVGGIDCFHYQNGSRELWIAVDSMLPVAAKSGDIVALYQFHPAPNPPVTLTPEEQAAFDHVQKVKKAFESIR